MTSVVTSEDQLMTRADSRRDDGQTEGRKASAGVQMTLEESLLPEGLSSEELAAFSENRVAMVDSNGLRAMGVLAEALSYLWVSLDAPGPQHRGRLGLYIEEAIEQQLEKRGALPPGIQASTGLDASLSDQLYRARFLEMRGIALGIPALEGITNLGRSLDAEDSAVLRWWIAAAADRPVQLVISSENTKLRVYPSPVLFQSLFDVAPMPVTPLPPSPQMADSSQSMELSDLPPAVEQTNVLGTEVVSLDSFEGTGSDSEDVGDLGLSDDEELEDVELPDLDRALGLAPDVEPVPAPSLVEEKVELRRSESPQLPLDYESPLPAVVNTQNEAARQPQHTRIASPAPPSDTEFVDEIETEMDPILAEESVSTSDYVPAGETASEVEAKGDDGLLSADDLAEIDADEFLRTLEVDSARAPQVDGVEEVDRETLEEEPPVVRASEVPVTAAAPQSAREESDSLQPLPRKKIARNPFIRMVDSSEALSSDQQDEPESSSSEAPAASPDEPSSIEVCSAVESEPSPAVERSEPDLNDPFNQLAAREWKTWVKNLEAARGPKPLSVIERMFVTDYTRLREAVRRGVADPSASEILDEWQVSFSKSYSEAFDALRVRGKRPTMVLDIVEMATRLGRLQGAKRVQLLLVDGLRFDLGLMVQDRMRQIADAALTERLLLWSALPSVTQYQLELLGRGPDGLKDADACGDEPPALVARGAAARVPRRVRTGSVELFKLDVVEDCLREVGAPVVQRMDSIAEQTATAIAEHLSKQAPRTMVVVFGDHGFALDPKKAGTTEEVMQGGSTPEEVLVPAFAWLTGAVH